MAAWAASRGTIDPPAWWLFAATVCWAIAYDTIYALQDREVVLLFVLGGCWIESLRLAKGGPHVAELAGAPLAGLARSLQGQLPVPVVDGVSSAMRHAATLVSLQAGKATRGSFAPPPVKPNRGLPPAISRLLDRGA
mgnify:CR=1 FL=1